MAKKSTFLEMHDAVGGSHSSQERVQQERERQKKREKKTAQLRQEALSVNSSTFLKMHNAVGGTYGGKSRNPWNVKKATSKANTASGLTPEAAEKMREQRAAWQAQLNVFDYDTLNQRLDAVTRNRTPDDYSRDPEYQKIMGMFQEEEALKEKIADADVQLNLYDNLDGFQTTRVDPLKKKEGFSTSRETWNKNATDKIVTGDSRVSQRMAEKQESKDSELSTLTEQRNAAQAELDAILTSEEYKKAQNLYQGTPEQERIIVKEAELRKKVADLDAQIAEKEAEELPGEKDTYLTLLTEDIDALTRNRTADEYGRDPEYQAALSAYEQVDEDYALGEYLDWYNGLDEDTRERLLEGRLNAQDPRNREIVKSTPSTVGKHWERMTEDEINAYYYIANTEGAQAAHDFLEDLQVTLDKRHTEGREQATIEQMEESPTWANALRGVATVGANVIGGPMAFASDAIRTAEGKDFNPYSNAHYLQNITGVTRSAAANDIQQTVAGDGKSAFWNGVGELAANAYQSALSSLDSVAGMYTMGNAYTISMGMGAASSRMRELYESGATDEEIYKGAIGSGILEALFEKVSLDTLAENFIKANPEKWVKKLLIQAGVEGSEEFFTEISNLVLDSVNRGINSDHNQRVRELMGNAENPMGREEAEHQATKEDVMDVFWAFLGGVMSGGMSSVNGAFMDASRQNQSGQDILSRNVQEQIIAEGQELRQGDKLAQSLETKQKEGTLGKNEGIFSGIKDSRDATRLGRLLEQNVADMTSKDRSAVKSAVTARLTDEGTRILDKEGTAEAIVKSLTGEGLGVYDRFLLASNEKVADKVRNEVYSAADGTTANNAWVKRIETYGHTTGTTLKETAVEKAGREAMETTVKEEFGQHAETVMKLYNINRGLQNRMDFVAEAKEVYQAGMDGVPLDQAPKTTTLTDFQREAVWDMGQGKSDYDYDNNQGFATIKGETTPVNIVAVESTDGGTLTLRTDDGQVVSAKDVTFGSYSQSKLYSVISAMGVDTETANEIVTMSNETGLDLNVFSRAMQDAFFAGRNGIPFADIPKDRYAMKLTEEQRKVAWKAGRAAARERAVQKGKRVQQGKHGRAKGGVKMEASAWNIQHLNAQQQAGMNAANVLGALGLDITVYASTEEQRAKGMENGYIQLSDGSIHIDLNSGDSGEGVMAWALSHEFTHFVEEMSPEKFQSFQDVLFQELGQSNQDVMELIESKVAELSSQEQYSEISEERLWEIATSEVVAEMMEPMLTDTDAIARISDNLRQQDKGLWEKIKDWLSGLVEKLKKAYKDLTPGSAIARQTREVVTQSEEILNAWVDMATDAIVNYTLQDGQKNNTPGGVRYSTRSLSDQIDDIANQTFDTKNHVYYGTTPRALSNILSIPIMPMLGTYTHAYTMALDEQQAANEGRKTKGLNFHGLGWNTVKSLPEMLNHPVAVIKSNTDVNDSRFVVVTNAVDGAGNPIIAALTPKGTGNYYDLDITSTVLLSGYGKNNFQNYLAKANSENRILWVNKKNHQKQASPGVQFPNALLSGDYTSNLAQFKQVVKNEFAGTVFQNTFDENGDRLFSSRNVQQTKNLVALHNITEDKFLKTLELGGFPMPSIAITKADIPHTNYGDITVVFGRETIDPKANRKNTVYSADAWTPTVPQVEYEADSKATNRVYKQLSGLKNQVDEYFRRDLSYATYNIENALNQYGGEEGVVQAALENYGVKAAYLEEQGKHITPETKQETVGTPVSEEMQNRYVKIMDILNVDYPEQIGQLVLKEVREQHGAELEAVYPGITKSALRLGGMLNRLKAWLQGNNGVETRTVTDVAATKNAVDSAIDQAKFEAWVRNLYQGVEKSSGVYNGKPRFTEAGNSRTFKQTHLPATLEGIVKAMAAQNGGNTKNVSGFNGVKTLRAGTAERFSSIADMHKMEGRLQNLTQVQQDEIHDSLSTRLYDVIKAIDEEAGRKLGGSNSLVRYDTIGEVLMEIAESGSYNVADIQRVFQQYGKTISDETAIAAKELLFDVSQMPVNIFEAKPERGVGFEEIKTVLVPDTASQKLLQELDSRGIPYQTYQAGNEEQRHQMVQDMEDVRFSKRSVTQLERENEKLRQDKEYLKELVKIQRQGNKDVVPTRASVNSMAETLKKQNGVRGNTAELAALLDEFYRYIGKGNLDTVEMDRLVGKAADWIQEHQQAKRDPYAQEVLDWMKKRHVSLSQTQVDEIKYQYGSLREYQSAIKGSIIIDQNANTSLNQLWQEGNNQYADQFGSDVTEGDMPGAFADMVERLRNSEDTDTAERRYRQEEFHRGLMSQVYNTYFSVKPVESISDTMQEKINSLLAEKANAERTNRQLERQNEQLRQEKEYLKELIKIQRQGNIDRVPKRSSVYAMAEKLKSETGATGSTKELAGLLDDFYRYIGKGNVNVDTSGRLSREVVRWIKEHQGAGDPSYELIVKVWDTYYEVTPVDSISDTMQRKINKLKEEKAEARKQYREDMAEVNAELQKQKEENRATLQAMQGIRKVALESYRRQQTASDQRMKQLYEQQYRLVMEDYQKQLAEADSEKASAKVESWRKTEERGKLYRNLSALNRMMLNPTKTAFVPDSLQPAVIHAMETFNDYRLSAKPDMARIQALRNKLDRLNLEGAKKNQAEIRKINRELNKLQGDYGSVQDTLTELKRMYAELISSNEGKVAQIYDEGVEGFLADALEAIGDTEYNDLSIEQLQALNDAYAAILHRVRTANNTFSYGQKEAIDQLAKRAGGEFAAQKDREKLTGENASMLEKFSWNNLKPGYAFERMGSATMTALYNNLRNGEDTFYRDVVDARAWALECMKEFDYGKWEDKLIEFESIDGKKFSLNLEERMSLYAYSRRRQAIEHLIKGGIVLNENTKRTVMGIFGIQTEKVLHDYNNYRLSLETIQAIGQSLTEQQKGFAEKMQSYLSTVCADKNNEVSRALYGVSKAKEKYYWPLKSSNLFSERVRNQQENPGNRQKNAGHMKATTPHANNPVEVSGFMDTWGNHVNNTAMYHAFTLPMEDFLRVYNFNNTAGATEESIVQLITKKHGKGATEYIDQFLKDLNKGARSDPREGIANALTSKFKKGAVSASLSVAIQQPSAVGRAFAVIDPKYFRITDMKYYGTSLVGKKAQKTQARWEEMKRYAPVVGIKEMGRFDVNMGRSTVDFITGAGETGFMAKVDELSGLLPEKMDQATWMMIYNAAERQCKAQGYTGENLKVATGKLFTEAITKTQVYDSVFSRSGNMRSKSLWMNMATSFMAEPTTTANMFMDAMSDAKQGNWKSAGRKWSSIAAATVLNAMLASFVYAARDDDDDKPYKEKLLKSFTSEMVDSFNPMGYVPIVKDIWSLFQGYDVDRADMTLWSEAANHLNRLKSAYEAMAELDEEDADYEEKLAAARQKVAESWGNAAGALCNMTGLPVKNVLREIRAIVNTWETVGDDREADWDTAKYAMWEALQENLPELIRDKDSKADELYKAMTSGSQVWVNRMRDSYSSDKAYENAVRGSLRDHDKRIRQAAKALNNNADSTEYKQIVNAILSEGHFTQEQVEKAIQAEAKSISGSLSGHSTQSIEKFIDLYEDDLLDAEQYTAFLEYRDAEGEDGKKIHHKDEMIVYIGSMKVNAKAKDTLYNLMDYDEKDLEKMPWHTSGYSQWEARVEIPELADYSDSAVETFLEIRNSQITAKVFTNAYEYRHAKDSEGKQLHTPAEIMAYIDSLSLSRENKDELYLAMGYKETTLNKTPWN